MSEATLNAPMLSNSKKRKLSDFLQLHWCTTYPPSLPNRDRDGEPKMIDYGGRRGRISSQCLKRTVRCGTLFNHAFGDPGDDDLGVRTKEFGGIIYNRLIEGGVAEQIAKQWTLILAAVFGPTKPEKKGTLDHLKNETMFLVSPSERKALFAYIDRIIAEKLLPPAVKGKEELEKEARKLRPQILQRKDTSIDIALFGRFFAGDKDYNVEASVQVAHAFSVHCMEVEDDSWTAVDDLKESGEAEGEGRGSGHMGDGSLIAGVFYNYASLNLSSLKEKLIDTERVVLATTKLIESFLTEFPRAKGNSSAQQARSIYGRLEYGQKTPRNLALSFFDPIEGKNIDRRAIDRLRETSKNIDKVYGPCYNEVAEFDALKGEGSIAALLALAERAARSVV